MAASSIIFCTLLLSLNITIFSFSSSSFHISDTCWLSPPWQVPQNLIHIGSGKTLITSLHVLLQQIFNTSKLMSKFIKGLHHRFLPDEADLPDSFFLGNYISKSSASQAVDKFRRMWSAVKRWHYELQAFVKWALEVNEFTAPLSNKEVIFFVASAVVVMPLMSAWALFL